jgi:hypothetical protein
LPEPFAGLRFVDFVLLREPPEPCFEDFARGLLSAKKFLSLVTQSPERRWPEIDLNTSVGANDQVDIRIPVSAPGKTGEQ